MSLYNAINGVNPATFYVLPMLGKHPEEYPRFRDCFIGALENSEEKDQFGIPKKKTTDEKVISVYTRTGGNNRGEFDNQIQLLRAVPTYIKDYDDDFDNTFAVFVFSVPEKWEKDFEKIVKEGGVGVSEEYKKQLKKVFPKLSEQFDKIFSK